MPQAPNPHRYFGIATARSRRLLPTTNAHRFWRIVQLSEKQLPANPAVGRLKHMVEEVKLTVPVVVDLRSGTLTDRHWKTLDDVLGMDIRAPGAATFKQMMEVRYWETCSIWQPLQKSMQCLGTLTETASSDRWSHNDCRRDVTLRRLPGFKG